MTVSPESQNLTSISEDKNLTQEAAGRVTAVHEVGEDTEGADVVASGEDGAANSASGGDT